MQCRRDASILFDESGVALCWVCSSRQKIALAAELPVSDAERELAERRAWKRYIVQMHMKFVYGGSEQSKVIFPGTTVNLSLGGMCIEWTPCEVCSGYTPGGVAPDCIFARYDMNAPGSEFMVLSLFLAEDDIVNLSAKVVFVIKQPKDGEYIGLSFTDLDEYSVNRLADIINMVTVDG